jgi:precorrin-2 dehydrogenase/sirohydrochlorin ferrochelatase
MGSKGEQSFMRLFPMFTKLEGRNCLVVGAGVVGEGKIGSLVEAGAAVTVVAPEATSVVADWARAGIVHWQARRFEPADLEGTFLAVVATDSTETNRIVFEEARQRGVLCNVVDDPEYCDFYYPAVVRRGNLQIAVSTGGLSPALAQRIRRELEQLFPVEYAAWIEEVGKERRELLRADLNQERRRTLLHQRVTQQAFANFVRGRKTKYIRRGGP